MVLRLDSKKKENKILEMLSTLPDGCKEDLFHC